MRFTLQSREGGILFKVNIFDFGCSEKNVPKKEIKMKMCVYFVLLFTYAFPIPECFDSAIVFKNLDPAHSLNVSIPQ